MERNVLDLESDFEESLSPSGQIALANRARRDDPKAILMLDVVQVVRAADLHSVQDIVEINPQLRLDSFAKEEPLGESQCLVTLERIPQARIIGSGVAYSPGPRILKFFDVEDGLACVVVVPIDVKRARQDVGPVRGIVVSQRAATLYNLHRRTTGIIVVSGNLPASHQVLHEGSPMVQELLPRTKRKLVHLADTQYVSAIVSCN